MLSGQNDTLFFQNDRRRSRHGLRGFRNSAAYVQNWLQVLKNDKRFIVSAAGKAEKAVDFILTGH